MMKKIFNHIGLFIVIVILLTGCQGKLVERPHDLTPLFLKTAQGFRQGLDAAYGGARYVWGDQDYFHLAVAGTDMWMRGNDGKADINEYNSDFTSTNGRVTSVWENCYQFINTCNAVIDFGPEVSDMDGKTIEEMVAEARFLRANYYFILVRFWGEVTLIKNFQSAPTTSAVRDPVAEVYEFIIQDLTEAIKHLPPSPLQNGILPGKANAAAARHLLARVYLTRAYSSAKQPDDFKTAADIAQKLINDAQLLGLGLLQDFGDIYKEGNEQNGEVLWTAQYTDNLAYNDPGNNLCFMYVPQYEKVPGMQRSTLYGRPYIRESPTMWLLDTAFAEKVNDTRYSKTFQTVWLCNNPGGAPVWPDPLPSGAPPDAVPGKPKFGLGDTAIYMPGYDVTDAQIAAAPYGLIPPRNYNISLAPAMMKYSDTKRIDMNAKSNRPVIVYRLGETYLIAAEALLGEGKVTEAAQYVNDIRKRAAYPTGDASAMEIKPGDLTLDFILDERARELCGELQRWPDLVRTHRLVTRVRLHNKPAGPNINDFHQLRPIPQEQIDRVTTGEEYPQNPGW